MVAQRVSAQPSSESKTIRVSKSVYDKLTVISESRFLTIGEVVARLVDEQTKKDFFQKMKDGYAELRADETAWREFQEELALWDGTLNDGLDDL